MAKKSGFSEFRTIDDLNGFLTKAMANQSIQSVIKEDALEAIAERVVQLATGADQQEMLRASATLGRLAAVAKSRESELVPYLDVILENPPGDLGTLSDGDEKYYASRGLSFIDKDWKAEYCVDQAVRIDTADAARRQLLENAIDATPDVAAWLLQIRSHLPPRSEFSNISSFMRRMRRIFQAILEILRNRDDLLGSNLPDALRLLAIHAFPKEARDAEEDVLFSTLDLYLQSLVRILQVRLALALESSSYRILQTLKHTLGPGLWASFLRDSSSVVPIRSLLCEASLILARQDRTDDDIITALVASFVSRPQLKSALRQRFESAEDVEKNIRSWWESAGEQRARKEQREQPMGNNEDRQIGELLLIAESHYGTMQVIPDTAVPILQMQDEVAAATVSKGAHAFIDMTQKVRGLARMRRLEKTDLKGRVIEYNPREHEMLGGHRPGVRKVRVLKDGITKDFGGRVRFLTKPEVESAE